MATESEELGKPQQQAAPKPTYAELSLRCQALELALHEERARVAAAQSALADTLAQHADELESLRAYHASQLAERQAELNLLSRPQAADAAVAVAAPSPGSSSLRRELAAAEAMLSGYEAANKQAAARITELERQLAAARASMADEAGRAQRAAAAAAEAERSSSAAAAERLARQLQLEGQLASLQGEWEEREASLLGQLEAARRDKREAEARAAAAAEGVDMARWQAEDTLVAELRARLAAQAAAHSAELQALRDKLAWQAEAGEGQEGREQLVSQQAGLIRELEARLLAAEGAAGRSQRARIAELQEQVAQLGAALQAQHPSSVPALLAAAKPGPGEAQALARAELTIQQLGAQLQEQAAAHERSLQRLQEAYSALQQRLQQQAANQESLAVGVQGGQRARELALQLEQQRALHTSQVADLQHQLHNAEQAAGIQGHGPASSAAVAAAATSSAGEQAALQSQLQHKERQLAALSAQLDERTSQFLVLQQKLRAAEAQRRQAHAAAAGDASSPPVPGSAGGRGSSRAVKSANAGAAGESSAPEVARSSDFDAPPAIAALRKRQQQRAQARQAGAAGSWPSLCAELEAEVEGLKARLAAMASEACTRDAQVQQLHARLSEAQTMPSSQRVAGDNLHQLVCVAEEVAAQEAARWRERVAASSEALQDAYAELGQLRSELARCRRRGHWSPGAAAFDRLERKLAALERGVAAPAAAQRSEQAQQYEAALAAKQAELDGFREQVSALLLAVQQLQAHHSLPGMTGSL